MRRKETRNDGENRNTIHFISLPSFLHRYWPLSVCICPEATEMEEEIWALEEFMIKLGK